MEYFQIDRKPEYGIFDEVYPNYLLPIAPEAEDLCRLHKLIRARKVFNVLEFGLGFSTIVMADALEKNYNDYSADPDAVEVRIREPFTIYCVDASEHWIDYFTNKYKDIVPYFNRIKINYSKCEAGEYNGQLCHYYTNIPNVITDFVYLDGPDSNDVAGKINGLSFQNCLERTVMSGDLLKMEPTFLQGMMILVDGRTNNARFLSNNFRRQYKSLYDEDQDITNRI